VAPSAFTDVACATATSDLCQALDLTTAGGSTGGYVRIGNVPSLQLSSFTLELWMRRDGAGVATSTGSGGITDAIPLVSKGRSENDTPANNLNYMLAVRASDGVLCADFEEGPTGPASGSAHPVAGTHPIPLGVWHHVAATYDGVTWTLYLDGALEATLAVNRPACNVSAVAAALGSALNSTGAAAGFFDGAIDEVRIWNVARTQAEIQATRFQSMSMGMPGLVGRWAFDESSGATAYETSGGNHHGSIVGTPVTNWSRTACGAWVTAVETPDIREISFARITPNPVRGPASFHFALPTSTHVRLEIHDLQGRRVALLADGTFDAGRHDLRWSGQRDGGGMAPAGMYFARFRAADRVTTRSFVVLR
jgi:hypothetical protein